VVAGLGGWLFTSGVWRASLLTLQVLLRVGYDPEIVSGLLRAGRGAARTVACGGGVAGGVGGSAGAESGAMSAARYQWSWPSQSATAIQDPKEIMVPSLNFCQPAAERMVTIRSSRGALAMSPTVGARCRCFRPAISLGDSPSEGSARLSSKLKDEMATRHTM